MRDFLRRTLLALVLILDLFLVYKLIFGAQGMVAYRDMLAKFVAVQREAEGADQRILALSQEIRWLKSDPDFLQAVIRSQTNALREDEILYILPERQAATGQKRDDHER